MGATWALVISVTDPIPSQMPYAEPPVHLETKAQCQMVADAINSKASQAGLESRISATCAEMQFLEVPEELKSQRLVK